MTVAAIPRTAWQDPAMPIVGPARRQRFRQGIVHWQGNNRNDTPTDIPQLLRSKQRDWTVNRGFSLGYGFAVVSDVTHPQDGTRWEIRGTDLNIASNPGKKWNDQKRQPSGNVNDWTGSVLLIGPADKPASPKAAEAVRAIFGEWHRAAGTPPVRPWRHGEVDYTTCCGPRYIDDLAAGRFDPTATPAPPIPEEDEEVSKPENVYIAKPPASAVGNPPWLVVERFGGGVRYATNFEDPAIRQVTLNQEQYDWLHRSVFG
jgi:hypothetical protein